MDGGMGEGKERVGKRGVDHFVDVTEMVEIGSGAKRPAKTVMMSRYACYLVIQNADPSKEIVAKGQTYFAIQTRRQELGDEELEEQRRLAIRADLRTHNTQLADAAKGAGVIDSRDYAIFQNHGYMGLYGGLGAQDIHRRKGLKKRASKSSTTWAAPNLPPISSELPKRRTNCAARKSPARTRRTKPTTKSEPKSARPSRNSAVPCPRNCPRRKASRSWNPRPAKP